MTFGGALGALLAKRRMTAVAPAEVLLLRSSTGTTALGLPVASLMSRKIGSDDPSFWTEHAAFQAEELRRRDEVWRQRGSEEREFFLSHCWRHDDAEIQRRKRRVVSYITGPDGKGRTFWADFLDLQSKGPVPWRKEIFEGIRRAAKFVAFVDREYLLSFNCVQEVAYAIELDKPIVVVVLVGGARVALEGAVSIIL